MDLQGYLRLMRKRWVSILLVTALCTAGAAAASLLMTPKYQATTQVFVSVSAGSSTSDLLSGSSFTQQRVKSYADLATSPIVLSTVVRDLELSITPQALATSVSADSPLDTVLINITVTDTSPEQAAKIANAAAISLADKVGQLERPTNGGTSPVKISVVSEAVPPETPSSPKIRLNLALGLLLGLALGIGQAILRESLDTKVRTESDVALVTDAGVLGAIAYDPDAKTTPLIVHDNRHSRRAEAFRMLRTNLQIGNVNRKPRSIVVTSALSNEGKTTMTLNLALTLASAGSSVVVVDADLRRPSIARYTGLEGAVGLTTVLAGHAKLGDVVQPWANGTVHVLPAGQLPPNPSELLGSRAMASILEQLTATYDFVLLDTPPLLPVTDAAILARISSGAVVVAGVGSLHRAQLAQALSSLTTIDANVLGVVLNRVSAKGPESYGYYDVDYVPLPPADATPAKPRAPRGARRSAS